jgi:hypothetical protein
MWSIALFCACLALNTRHNRFPYYYHPDEPGKVEQIMEGPVESASSSAFARTHEALRSRAADGAGDRRHRTHRWRGANFTSYRGAELSSRINGAAGPQRSSVVLD